MEAVVVILIIVALGAGVLWNHQNANKAREGVSFVVPYPPTAVSAAIDQAHNQGTRAALGRAFGGMTVTSLGSSGFGTSSKIGDSGQISVSREPSGSLVTARALDLYVGMPPKQLNNRGGLYGLSVSICHGIYTMLGITPGSAKVKRWQNGLESRVTKVLSRATS